MEGKIGTFMKMIGVLAIVLISVGFSPCDELYLFQDGKSVLITNTPAQGYSKKVGHHAIRSTALLSPPAAESYSRMIEKISKMHSLSPSLVKAVIQVESAYNSSAVSPKGAKGLMQLIDDTARRFGVQDVFDPYQNVLGGVRYLRYLLDYFDGDLSLALAAYNAGEKAVLNFGGIPPYAETINYVKNVKKVLGFSDGRSKNKKTVEEALPYINLSSGGKINIVN